MQTKLDWDVQNRNPSKLRGFAFLKDNPPSNNVYKLHGVPRSGRTTALAACSIDLREPFLLVAPVKSITNGVIGEQIKEYVDRSDVGGIINIPGNKDCELNEELCDKYPQLRSLRFIPIGGKCDECDHLKECPVTAIMMAQTVEGITLTYPKLVALKLASMKETKKGKQPMAKRIMDKIKRTVKNIILDEAHVTGFGKATKMNIYDLAEHRNVVDLTPFEKIDKDYGYIRSIIDDFTVIMNSPGLKDAVEKLKTDAENQEWNKKRMSVAVENPVYDPKGRDGVFIIAAYNELIKLIMDCVDHGLDCGHIAVIQDMLDVIMNKTVHCQASKKSNGNIIEMVAIDGVYQNTLRSFLIEMRRPHRRMILTSATFCSYDYKKLFYNNTNIKEVIFGLPGEHGDPNDSCSKMMIIPDTFNFSSMGRYSVYHMLEYIMTKYYMLINTFGYENVEVVTTSIRVAEMVNKYCGIPCGYYRSSSMIGVANEKRIVMMIGAATPPINAFDAFTNSKEESRIMWEENMAVDTYQALNRFKDPAGKEPSLVFAVGINQERCESICTWGPGRRVVQDLCRTDDRHVIVERSLASPIIVKNQSTVGIPTIALLHMKKRNMRGFRELYNNETSQLAEEDILNKVEHLQTENTYNNNILYRANETASVSTNLDLSKNQTNDECDINIEDQQYEDYITNLGNILYDKWLNEDPFGKRMKDFIMKITNAHPDGNSGGRVVSTGPAELPDEEQYLVDQLAMIRRSTQGMRYTDPVALITDCFFLRRDVVAVQVGAGYSPVRANMRDTSSECIPLNEDMLLGHLAGLHTIGAYTLAPPGTYGTTTLSQWICFDIDAHKKDDDTVYDLMAKQKTAEKKQKMLRNLLAKYGIPYLLERSGTEFSYHVWIFHKPINPKIPNWLGKQIWKVLGYPKTEAFPKQTELKSKTEYGNLVKIPLGTHQKNGRKSYIWVDGKWVRWEEGVWVDEDGNALEKQEIWIYPVDLSSVVVPPMTKNHDAKKGEASYSHDYSGYNRNTGTGKFFEWAIQQQLTDDQGDWVRRMVVAYYINLGITDIDALVNLFRGQDDFNEEVTRKKLPYSLKKMYATPGWERIVEMAPDIAACFKEGRDYVWKKTE